MERDRLQYPGDDSRSGGSAIKDISDDKLKCKDVGGWGAESAENAALWAIFTWKNTQRWKEDVID